MQHWWDLFVRQLRITSGVILVAGLWEIMAPFVLGYAGSPTPTINAIAVGTIAAVLAGVQYGGAYRATWISWVNSTLGLWLIVAPFILGYGNPARINDIIVGVVIGFFGALSAAVSETAEVD
jgi:hypothetical protein